MVAGSKVLNLAKLERLLCQVSVRPFMYTENIRSYFIEPGRCLEVPSMKLVLYSMSILAQELLVKKFTCSQHIVSFPEPLSTYV